MKYVSVLLSLMVLLLVACEYESPLTNKRAIAIEPAVLGLWEFVPDDGEGAEKIESMLILKYSDTEYLIHYPVAGNDEAYYRGYPIEIGGVACVQLEIIGTDDGPIDRGEKNLFHVVSYQLGNNELEIKLLNSKLVDKNLKTSKALKRAFLKHKDNKELFVEPGRFRKKLSVNN